MTPKNKLIKTLIKESNDLYAWAEGLKLVPDEALDLDWVERVLENEESWNIVLNALRSYHDELSLEILEGR